jgi:hypothetical protein
MRFITLLLGDEMASVILKVVTSKYKNKKSVNTDRRMVLKEKKENLLTDVCTDKHIKFLEEKAKI